MRQDFNHTFFNIRDIFSTLIVKYGFEIQKYLVRQRFYHTFLIIKHNSKKYDKMLHVTNFHRG